ncbi:MAG TPA: helix-turn-helix domain-containing protein [Actinomycetota bacterium]|nr:helix-turn-helix domain-containing protein [Actinomycetota bacterium]
MAGTYDPNEIAIAVIALEDGYSLSYIAAYLRRDRSGLHRALRRLGYPTRPVKPDPQAQREAVEEAIASIDVWTRIELRADLTQVRSIICAMPSPPP